MLIGRESEHGAHWAMAGKNVTSTHLRPTVRLSPLLKMTSLPFAVHLTCESLFLDGGQTVMTGGGCTHGLSSPVGEVLPKQQTQLSGDSHIDVFPTSLRTLQLLAVKPNRKICRSVTEITNVSPATGKNLHSLLQAKLCDYIRVRNKGQKSNINVGKQIKGKDEL